MLKRKSIGIKNPMLDGCFMGVIIPHIFIELRMAEKERILSTPWIMVGL
jgi:hypothetical protein